MRTTLTLDEDVVALLERFRGERRTTFKDAVNTALRRGLTAADGPAPAARFQTRVWESGRPLINQFDDVSEVLAIAEGDEFA